MLHSNLILGLYTPLEGTKTLFHLCHLETFSIHCVLGWSEGLAVHPRPSSPSRIMTTGTYIHWPLSHQKDSYSCVSKSQSDSVREHLSKIPHVQGETSSGEHYYSIWWALDEVWAKVEVLGSGPWPLPQLTNLQRCTALPFYLTITVLLNCNWLILSVLTQKNKNWFRFKCMKHKW